MLKRQGSLLCFGKRPLASFVVSGKRAPEGMMWNSKKEDLLWKKMYLIFLEAWFLTTG